MNKEIWKDITGYEGLYQVSDQGRVKSLKRKGCKKERVLKPAVDQGGYLIVTLSDGEKRKNFKVHRIVCEAFHENHDEKTQVNHINEIKTDNRACNLEWCTAKENINHGTRNTRAGKAIAKALGKPVGQYTIGGELIKVFSSTNEVQRITGFSQGSIWGVANGRYKQAYGFIWKYIEVI